MSRGEPAAAAALRRTLQWTGLIAGPLLALATYFLLPAAESATTGLPPEGRAAAAVLVWMAIWWLTEAVEIPVTALLPLALLPLTGATTMRQAAAPYGHDLIFLFLGGFILALALQRWRLDRRIALATLRLTGDRPGQVVGGLMLVTAALSMWVSNTATTAMMLPIAVSVLERVREDEGGDPAAGGRFATALLLGIAYAASIGGVGTVIGSPPNLFAVSFLRESLGLEVSFVQWMGIGLPVVALFLPLAWWLLTRRLYPVAGTRIEGDPGRALAELGPMERGAWATLAVFLVTAALWITRPLLTGLTLGGVQPLAGLTDAGIAITAALALFVIPVDLRRRRFLMDWSTAVRLPWGVLILFGGGLSLGSALQETGVAHYLGDRVAGLSGLPPLLFVALVTTLVIFLTEVTSNTATAAIFVPILAGVAPSLGLAPLSLVLPTALAASCAFMMPVATPPNAIVFASGRLTIPQMARAGLRLNLAGVLILVAVVEWVGLPLLGR